MKKIFFLTTILAMSLFSATNEEIINHFKSVIKLDGFEYKVTTRKNIEGYPGYEFAIVEVSQSNNVTNNMHHDGKTQKLQVIIKDNIIFPEAVDIKRNRSLLEDFVNN
ncbi:MAG: hypothetical protein LBG67_02015 [Campylobacteraceae bacterium]|nr:hypothetical protein [Campylobacteraceae bacterium]